MLHPLLPQASPDGPLGCSCSGSSSGGGHSRRSGTCKLRACGGGCNRRGRDSMEGRLRYQGWRAGKGKEASRPMIQCPVRHSAQIRQLLTCLGHIACTEHATKIHMAAVENPEGLFMFCRSIYQNFFYISSGLYLYNAIFADIHIGLAFQIARNLFRERERERDSSKTWMPYSLLTPD